MNPRIHTRDLIHRPHSSTRWDRPMATRRREPGWLTEMVCNALGVLLIGLFVIFCVWLSGVIR